MPQLANFSWCGLMYHNARVIFCTDLSPVDLTLSRVHPTFILWSCSVSLTKEISLTQP